MDKVMGWSPITVVVPTPWIKRCGEFGRDLANDVRINRAGRDDILPEWTSKRDQGLSKLCEVIGALACEVDPETLDWTIGRVDRGHDFALPSGMTIDVKGTWRPNARYLIYPVNKRHLWPNLTVDAFMQVWCEGNTKSKNFGYGEARGWIKRIDFGEMRYTVKKGDGRRFAHGTWCMHERHLMPMAELVAGKLRDDRQLRAEIFGGTAPTTETRYADRGDGKVAGGLGEQTV
jgi:hypothetical protein